MIISTLLHGWVQRSFIFILMLVAIAVKFEGMKVDLLYTLVAFISLTMFLMVATRLPLLTHSSMAKLLPDYHRKLKQSLIIIMIMGLLPTLLILPDVVLWLGVMSVIILTAITFVAMIYRPIYQAFFWGLFFSPIAFDLLAPELSGRDIMTFSAWLLPLMIVLANYSLNQLMQYRGNTKHVNRLISLMNVRMEKSLAVNESVPLHERTKFSQWWSNTNFDYYRQLLNKSRLANSQKNELSNKQLIATCCQGVNSFGRSAYLIWACAIGGICIIGLIVGESYHRFFTMLMTLIPVMIIGTGTIATFQIIQNKKSLLARIAQTPRFSAPNSFTKSFISYVTINQGTLYIFISILVGIMASVFHHVNLNTYINLLLILALFCLVNLTMMFFAWAAKQDHSNKVVWLMIIGLVVLVVFALLLKENENIELMFSMSFIFVCPMIIALFGYSLHRFSRLNHS